MRLSNFGCKASISLVWHDSVQGLEADVDAAWVVQSTAFADNAAALPKAQTHYRISFFEH
jgi:hypothetical protein